MTEIDTGVRCSEHIGQVYPPRCYECQSLTAAEEADHFREVTKMIGDDHVAVLHNMVEGVSTAYALGGDQVTQADVIRGSTKWIPLRGRSTYIPNSECPTHRGWPLRAESPPVCDRCKEIESSKNDGRN